MVDAVVVVVVVVVVLILLPGAVHHSVGNFQDFLQ